MIATSTWIIPKMIATSNVVLQEIPHGLDGDLRVAHGLRHGAGAAVVETPAVAEAAHDGTAVPQAELITGGKIWFLSRFLSTKSIEM